MSLTTCGFILFFSFLAMVVVDLIFVIKQRQAIIRSENKQSAMYEVISEFFRKEIENNER